MKKLALLLFLLILAVPAVAQKREETTTFKIYFVNYTRQKDKDSCQEVFPVTRTVPKTAAVAKAALEQLFAGPTKEEQKKAYSSFFSDKTKSLLISVKIKNQAAYVNLKKLEAFLSSGANSSCGGGTFSQIEQTLLQFPTIKKVFYAFEGDPADFYDWAQVGDCPEELKNCDGSDFQ